ncbi:MAG: hypothetical protein PHE49_06710 [bacterium]|nr:hypothetical protein [bacterium]
MKNKTPLIFSLIIILAPSFAHGFKSYFHVCPLSLDKGFPSYTSMDFMELGFGVGPVVVGTDFIGYKVVPGGHHYNVEMFPLKAYIILSDSKKMKLYTYLNYSPFGDAGDCYYYLSYVPISSAVHSFSLGIGATFYHSMRLCLGYYNSEGPYNLHSSNIYTSLGVGVPDFYGKWKLVKGKKDTFGRIATSMLCGVLAGPLVGFAGFLAFDVINGSEPISPDDDAFPIVFLGAPVGAIVGLASGLYWNTCK